MPKVYARFNAPAIVGTSRHAGTCGDGLEGRGKPDLHGGYPLRSSDGTYIPAPLAP